MRWVNWLIVGAITGLTTAALAHTDEYFDKMQVPHGGQIRMAGPYHLELVVGAGELTVYVSDHGNNPIETTGGTAKAIIMSGKNRYVVLLAASGENVLKGSGEFKLGKSNTVNLMVTLPDQEPQRAKFTFKLSGGKAVPASATETTHQHHQHHE